LYRTAFNSGSSKLTAVSISHHRIQSLPENFPSFPVLLRKAAAQENPNRNALAVI